MIRGNPTFTLYFLVALLKKNEKALLAASSVEEIEEIILYMPWSVEKEDVPSLIESACVAEYLTPVSTHYCLICAYNQCSSSLLPDLLPGTLDLWLSRYKRFVSHMFLSKNDQLLNDFHRFDGVEGYLETYLLQQTTVYRVLSRDLFYLPYPTMCSLQGISFYMGY